ncbi:hypothetical protein OV079_03490 [Nannocystis pusilla]|uniref:Uncharacterized protein n=1 Tax=Nannocystis pusilla TaxID=889268 RepID=A0A9X3IUR6_9BACT|nr:hypothetical protein [Nannocystis pusilla]MCY1004646.1 hypothetical protein [Nannocystis pusilla]
MLVRLALAPLLGAAQVPAPPEVALEWRAPAGCPERDEVLAAVARRLGRPLTAEEVDVEATVVREGGRGFTLRLRLTAGQRGETRTVSDPSCAALADVVAVLVAAAVEPARVPEPAPTTPPVPVQPAEPGLEPEAAPLPEAAPEFAPEPAPVTDEPPEPLAPPVSSRRSKRPGGFVRVHGGGEVGAVPRITGAVGVAGGALAALAPGGAGAVRGPAGGPARVGRAAGRGGGGAVRGGGPRLRPAGARARRGAAVRRARGGGHARRGARPRLRARGDAGLARRRARRRGRVARGGPLGRVGGGAVALSPVHPKFELEAVPDPVRLWAPSWASGRLMLGVELRFGDPW